MNSPRNEPAAPAAPIAPAAIDSSLQLACVALDELVARQRAETTLSGLELQLDLRDKFLSLLSHDLRNPLAVAKASASLIARREDSPEYCRKLSTRIVEAVDRADKMISDLLIANRLRSGLQLPVERTSCELRGMLAHWLEELFLVDPKRYYFDAPVSVDAFIDATAVRRALENLVTNALKYGCQKSPVSVILCETREQVKISVHNRGEPLSAEDRAALFQWYSRSRRAVASGSPGWGLGLMVVQGIAQAHGGSVSVESDLETGTTFTLTLSRK